MECKGINCFRLKLTFLFEHENFTAYTACWTYVQDINEDTDYQSFKKKWGHDSRFESLDRKEREVLLNERY